jgi:CBS domain-containing protein
VDSGPSVPVTATMRDALAALLDGGTGSVAVQDATGTPIGVLTATEIAQAGLSSGTEGGQPDDPADEQPVHRAG